VRIGPRDGRGRVNGGREWCTVVVVPKSGASETLGVRGAEGKGTSERSDGGSVKGTCEIKELARWRDPLRRGGLTMSRSGGSDCAGPRDAAKRGNDGVENRTDGNGWEPDASPWTLEPSKDANLEIARAGVDGPRWECTEHGPSCSENRGRVIDTYLLKIWPGRWMESSCGWTRDASRAYMPGVGTGDAKQSC
jgi:hypothetical protein